MGFRFRRRSSGPSPRSPTGPQNRDAVPPLAARREEMLAQPTALSINERLFFWLAIIGTVAASAAYLIYTSP
jgi:hypothetical protein